MAAPAKYRKLGDFPDYAQGRRLFPRPVYFIGGNHEPWGFLDSLPVGASIAPNCIFMGRSGVMEIQTLAVAGLSGIYAPDRFKTRPDIERVRSISNKAFISFTEAEVLDLLDSSHADILVAHEWPMSGPWV